MASLANSGGQYIRASEALHLESVRDSWLAQTADGL